MLVVDDQPDLLKAVRRMLNVMNVDIVTTTTASEALESALREPPQLALVDVHLIGSDGIELMATLRQRLPAITVGAISGEFTDKIVTRCREAGVAWCLDKPFDRETLITAIVVGNPRPPEMLRLDRSIDAVTDEYIERVMMAEGGNKSAAARVLGQSRQALQARLKRKSSSE